MRHQEKIVNQLVDLAEIQPYQSILEPSAGRGAIVKGILDRYSSDVDIDMCELLDLNYNYLKDNFIEQNSNTSLHLLQEKDFLKLPIEKKYHRIIANPPFNKNQDIKHILKNV